MSYFEAKGISKRVHPEKPGYLFHNASLTVSQGELVAITGPSGIGKTTFLKCLADLIIYEEGECLLQQESRKSFTASNWRARVTYIPQRPPAMPGTPLEFLDRVKQLKAQAARVTQFDDPIKIGLEWNLSEHLWYEEWSTLSGGEMQRMQLALGLSLKPDVVLLDEPTSALDAATTLLVEETLKKYTVIMVTHSQEQAFRIATSQLQFHPPEHPGTPARTEQRDVEGSRRGFDWQDAWYSAQSGRETPRSTKSGKTNGTNGKKAQDGRLAEILVQERVQ
ncbi:hypothetical protein BZG36_02980 [Bifiguratus adelaidae]|uniref:ABC transporter domain-containing protein n=1 Tax=Bifiguratus adelaidae TaxID=1938954 RepID=A0A261XYP2_9FUNG|nr:hypothetical protein BZG36_02980 [Bifiguratus adelaidae]